VENFDVALTHTHIPFELDIPTIQKYHGCSRKQRPFFRQELSGPKKIVDSLIDPTRRIIEQRSIRHLDFAIFNSKLCRDAWKEYYEVEPSTTVIHNGVDTEIFYPREVEEIEDYILFVGDSVRKGLPTVKEYADKLSEEVWVVGPSEIEDENITALGRVNQDRLAELYTGAVATVHPARFEAFGNVILESLACGTPVVISDQCGAAEIVDKTCGRVTTNLPEGVESVKGIDRNVCVEKARNFTWSKVADQTISEIKDIIF
jgi:glycosyltransferase involved in cell wall biosynthesis